LRDTYLKAILKIKIEKVTYATIKVQERQEKKVKENEEEKRTSGERTA
jgi:hypothetical protein